MEKPADNGFSTKVTYLGNSKWGCRILHNGEVFDQKVVDSKSMISKTIAEMLRWIDKLGYYCPMADASRTRNSCPNKK